MTDHRRTGLTAVEVAIAVIVLAVCIAVAIPFLNKARDRGIIAANELLLEAIFNNDLELAEAAFRRGAEPNSITPSRLFVSPYRAVAVEGSVLSLAVRMHDESHDLTDIIQLLLDEGADIHSVGDYPGLDESLVGWGDRVSPLRYAIHHDKLDLVKFFVEYGVDVNTVYGDKSLLEWAEYDRRGAIAEYLRSQGATEQPDD